MYRIKSQGAAASFLGNVVDNVGQIHKIRLCARSFYNFIMIASSLEGHVEPIDQAGVARSDVTADRESNELVALGDELQNFLLALNTPYLGQLIHDAGVHVENPRALTDLSEQEFMKQFRYLFDRLRHGCMDLLRGRACVQLDYLQDTLSPEAELATLTHLIDLLPQIKGAGIHAIKPARPSVGRTVFARTRESIRERLPSWAKRQRGLQTRIEKEELGKVLYIGDDGRLGTVIESMRISTGGRAMSIGILAEDSELNSDELAPRLYR